jgi:hypothetical protein
MAQRAALVTASRQMARLCSVWTASALASPQFFSAHAARRRQARRETRGPRQDVTGGPVCVLDGGVYTCLGGSWPACSSGVEPDSPCAPGSAGCMGCSESAGFTCGCAHLKLSARGRVPGSRFLVLAAKWSPRGAMGTVRRWEFRPRAPPTEGMPQERENENRVPDPGHPSPAYSFASPRAKMEAT